MLKEAGIGLIDWYDKEVMKISVRPSIFRTVYLLILTIAAFALLFSAKQLLGPVFPSTSTIMLYLTPMLLGVAVMTIVLIQSRESLTKAESREHELAASQERFVNLYKNSPVPYINIDGEGMVSMVNLAGMRLFDAAEKKIIGISLFDHFFHENETRLSILIHQLQNKIVLSDIEIQFKTISGHTKWVLLSAFADGLEGEMLVSLVDITRQKEIDIAKTEFVTLASHQLRTPIAAVRWNLELLQSLHKETTSEQDTYYFKINRNVERLTGLVNDFLHVSKLELGTFASDPQRIELAAFLDNSLGEFDKTIEDKKINIITSYAPDTLFCELDPRLLRITIDNLLSNALKYTPDEGTITVSYEVGKKGIVLSVTDTGIGIPIEEQGYIFNRFYRASNAEKQHAEGTGLGLYIVQQAVIKLGGSISFESIPGKGTSFTMKVKV